MRPAWKLRDRRRHHVAAEKARLGLAGGKPLQQARSAAPCSPEGPRPAHGSLGAVVAHRQRLLQHHRADDTREGDDEQHREPARAGDGVSAFGRLAPPRGHSDTSVECGMMNHSRPARERAPRVWFVGVVVEFLA